MKTILALVFVAVVCAGCSDQGGMSADQLKQVGDVNAMAKASNGDWNKLTPAQQQEMIKATGSEGTAKQVLYIKAHGPNKAAPGGPPHPSG